MTINGMQITMRPKGPEDEQFLYELYASTREEELSIIDWSEQEREKFLRMQFGAQSGHYALNFPDAEYLIILHDERPIGRLMVYRAEKEHHFLEIGFLTEYRGRGLGSAIITGLMDECRRENKPAWFHVEKINGKAMKLYQRLGFVFTSEIPTHFKMGWHPDPEKMPEAYTPAPSSFPPVFT